MRGRPYYEEPEYHRYLLSRERREIFPRNTILSQLAWDGVMHLLDFGMGNGYFLPTFYEFLPGDAEVWGAECQEDLIDQTLARKVREGIERFMPFHVERTEHPLLPDWIPEMDMIVCSCVLSTFADPALAIRGVGRAMKDDGRMVVLDWEKKEAPHGPELEQKVSRDRMAFFVEDAGYNISKNLRINEFVYGLELEKGEEARQDRAEEFMYLDY